MALNAFDDSFLAQLKNVRLKGLIINCVVDYAGYFF